MSGLAGGCACGGVRYRLGAIPFDAGWCHCRTCQLNSGSPAMSFASIAVDAYVVTEGEALVGRFASSHFGHRRFCTRCGTPLLVQVDHQPTTVDFSVATLDDPGSVVPGFHIFWASRVPWFPAGDALPKHVRFRPGTVGLDGTEPPSA